VKQIVFKKGSIYTEEIPAPPVDENKILVKTHYALISSGTELSGIAASSGSLIKKAITQPEKVKKVINRYKQVGFKRALDFVDSQIETPKGSGYSCAGEVIAVGTKVHGFQAGDQVAVAGEHHADYVLARPHLTVRLFDNISTKEGAFLALGAIALQGVRRADNRIGEIAAVIGLGLLGILTVQLLKVAGNRVIGIDISEQKLQNAKQYGCDYLLLNKENVKEKVFNVTDGSGVDSVIITAASKSSAPVKQAIAICRRKGKIVVVGDVDMHLPRADFYRKELDFFISTSYGPGRYDQRYEELSIDYPIDYVRWTENRNMQAFIDLVAQKKIDILSMVSQIYSIENVTQAYADIQNPEKNILAALIEFSKADSYTTKKNYSVKPIDKSKINVGIIGTGDFAQGTLLPIINDNKNYRINAACSLDGLSADSTAKRYGASYATTDYQQILANPEIDLVVIATRHNSHAPIAIEAAKAGKAIFSEKPMAVNTKELKELEQTLKETGIPYLVGFNRRFSPFAQKIKNIFATRSNPLIMTYRINAGYIPPDHWVHGDEGGGRLIGEGCHFIDFCNCIVNKKIIEANIVAIDKQSANYQRNDNYSLTLTYEDGSVATIIYTALGKKEFPKEYIEIFSDGEIYIIDDFIKLTSTNSLLPGFKLKRQEKGHVEEFNVLLSLIKHDVSLPIDDFIQTTELTIYLNQKIQ